MHFLRKNVGTTTQNNYFLDGIKVIVTNRVSIKIER